MNPNLTGFIPNDEQVVGWYVDDGYAHPVAWGVIRCHARLDEPNAPSFVVEGNQVFTVEGVYCGDMHRCAKHRSSGVPYGRECIGMLRTP